MIHPQPPHPDAIRRAVMAAYGRIAGSGNFLPTHRPAPGPPDRPRRAASRARLRQAGGRRDPDRSGGVVNPRDGRLPDPVAHLVGERLTGLPDLANMAI